jgi:hypothetical protein
MGGHDLDYDFQVPFGAYVQANQENNPTNLTAVPRALIAFICINGYARRPLCNGFK